MEKYFLVTVVIKDMNEKGKITKTTEQYLTLTTGCTEAEADERIALMQIVARRTQ